MRAYNDYIAEYGSELSIVQAPARGQVEFEAFWQEDGHRLGRYFYRPEPGFSGRDHFLYAVCGPSGVCSQARVRIDVKPRTALNVWRIDRRGYAVIGTEIAHARDIVYCDDLDLAREAAFEPIGVSCRICERLTCPQRSVPPLNRAISIDSNDRRLIPYEIR